MNILRVIALALGGLAVGASFVGCNDELLAPAPLDADTTAAAQALGIQAFRLLGCSGMARVDLFLERDEGKLWVSEVNTIPGFTSISMFPRLWELSGLGYSALVDELIRLALQRAGRGVNRA